MPPRDLSRRAALWHGGCTDLPVGGRVRVISFHISFKTEFCLEVQRSAWFRACLQPLCDNPLMQGKSVMDSLLEIPEEFGDALEGIGFDTGAELDSPPESVLVSATAVLAAVATRRGLKALWKNRRGCDPPDNPSAMGVAWSDVLVWAAAVGAAAGVARVLGRRSASAAARKLAARRNR